MNQHEMVPSKVPIYDINAIQFPRPGSSTRNGRTQKGIPTFHRPLRKRAAKDRNHPNSPEKHAIYYFPFAANEQSPEQQNPLGARRSSAPPLRATESPAARSKESCNSTKWRRDPPANPKPTQHDRRRERDPTPDCLEANSQTHQTTQSLLTHHTNPSPPFLAQSPNKCSTPE
ncbi:hypothetical protein SEVIR_1G329350v4 [Setaria viridis]